MKILKLGTFFFCLIFFGNSNLFAAYPNRRIIITDVMDDDIRAIFHLLSDFEKRKTIEAFVVTTGNVYLKAAILREIIATTGYSVPVFEGTPTNLRDNPVTFFAGNFELEGKHVLDPQLLKDLKKLRWNKGTAAEKIKEIIARVHKSKEKLDVILLTAPIDLVEALKITDPNLSKETFGDLFAMGLYRRNPNGPWGMPFNFQAGSESVQALFQSVDAGFFERAFHVPTDTVQEGAGLPGGYFPESIIGSELKARLAKVLEGDQQLSSHFKAAQEYGLAWWSSAGQQFGLGLTNNSRWVAGTLKNPAEATGFYVADHLPVVLSNLTDIELQKLSFKAGTQRPLKNSDGTWAFQSVEPDAMSGGFVDLVSRDGLVKDLEFIDGLGILRIHLEQLEKLAEARAKNPANFFSAFVATPNFKFSLKNEVERKSSARSNPLANPLKPQKEGPLLLVFKNSPDDWLALIHLVAEPNSRKALQAGGIIVEGFDTLLQQKSVLEFLKSLGIESIPVAQGFEYSFEQINKFPNFQGEIALSQFKHSHRAFHKSDEAIDPSKILTSHLLLAKIFAEAQKTNKKIDTVVLGEGMDVVNFLNSNQEFVSSLGEVAIMGGGRKGKQVGTIDFTRNWLLNRGEILKFWQKVAPSTQGVFVFSTSEFGATLLAEKNGDLGNASAAIKGLKENSATFPALTQVIDHWENWSRVFDWVINGSKKGEAFQPEKTFDVVRVSSLGVHIADAYISGALTHRRHGWDFTEVDPLKLLNDSALTPKEGSSFYWITNQTPGEVAEVSERFADALGHFTKSKNCYENLKIIFLSN